MSNMQNSACTLKYNKYVFDDILSHIMHHLWPGCIMCNAMVLFPCQILCKLQKMTNKRSPGWRKIDEHWMAIMKIYLSPLKIASIFHFNAFIMVLFCGIVLKRHMAQALAPWWLGISKWRFFFPPPCHPKPNNLPIKFPQKLLLHYEAANKIKTKTKMGDPLERFIQVRRWNPSHHEIKM